MTARPRSFEPAAPAHRARRGFTIIEVIVIVVILGVLAAVIAPRLMSRIGQSKQGVAANSAASLASLLRMVMIDNDGRLPSGCTIDVLWERPGEIPENKWKGPYVNNRGELLDPWERPFMLVFPGEKNVDFDVVSYGADAQPGGADEDADIIKP
jgi:general secretion pathway protein G